jgi:hypothetical protein
MRVATVCLQAALLTAATCGDFGSSPAVSQVVGASSAQAKNFYTRKRVNGKWIMGRFAKHRSVVNERKVAGNGARAAAGVAGVAAVTAPVLEAERPFTHAFALRAGPLAPPPDGEHMLRLERALKMHAHRLRTATSTEHVSSAQEVRPPAPSATGGAPTASTRPDARSVWLDFDSGVKTTLFRDGSTTVESFDVPTLKALASSRPPEKR